MNVTVQETNYQVSIQEDETVNNVTVTEETVSVISVAEQGPEGIQGPVGPQGPQGPPGALGSDSYFEQSFTNQATVTVTHNLGKRPAVTIIDSAGDEVEGEIEHAGLNQLTVTFSTSFTGIIYCN